jgi:hypothetical protein
MTKYLTITLTLFTLIYAPLDGRSLKGWFLSVQDMETGGTDLYRLKRDTSQVLTLGDGTKCIIDKPDGTRRAIICTLRCGGSMRGFGTESLMGEDVRLHIYEADADWRYTIQMGLR